MEAKPLIVAKDFLNKNTKPGMGNHPMLIIERAINIALEIQKEEYKKQYDSLYNEFFMNGGKLSWNQKRKKKNLLKEMQSNNNLASMYGGTDSIGDTPHHLEEINAPVYPGEQSQPRSIDRPAVHPGLGVPPLPDEPMVQPQQYQQPQSTMPQQQTRYQKQWEEQPQEDRRY